MEGQANPPTDQSQEPYLAPLLAVMVAAGPDGPTSWSTSPSTAWRCLGDIQGPAFSRYKTYVRIVVDGPAAP
jgi:hypothetical protein